MDRVIVVLRCVGVAVSVAACAFAGAGIAHAQDPPKPAPPPGALLSSFWRNQIQNCTAICPYLLDGVIDVPVALVQAPGVYGEALAATGSQPRATGIAAASVTGPADAAMTGIIDNDVNIVLPRAQNAFEVGVVESMNVAAAVGDPSIGPTFDNARAEFLDGLDRPLVRNPEPIVEPATPAQADVVDAIRVGSAVLFHAPELGMVGATDAADDAATAYAATGDVAAAQDAAQQSIDATLERATAVIDATMAGQWPPPPS